MIRLIETIKDGDAPEVTTKRLCTRAELRECFGRPTEPQPPRGQGRPKYQSVRYWQITVIETTARNPVSHRREKTVFRRYLRAKILPRDFHVNTGG